LIVSPTYGKNIITTSELTTQLSYGYKRMRSFGAGANEGLGLTIRNNHIVKYANSMRKGKKGLNTFIVKVVHIRRRCPMWNNTNGTANMIFELYT
jgi:hypothetical protein